MIDLIQILSSDPSAFTLTQELPESPRIRVRNLMWGEKLPDELKTGWEKAQLDSDWVWVAIQSGGKICASLIASPAHGLVILLRICSLKGAPRETITLLLRHAFKDMIARGYVGFISWLNPTTEEGRKILRLVKKAKGGQMDFPQVFVWGPLNVEEKLIG